MRWLKADGGNGEARKMDQNRLDKFCRGNSKMGNEKFYKLPCRLAQSKGLNANAKIIYAIIADRMGFNPTCWPSERTLADDVGVNRSTVRMALQQLTKLGYVEVINNGRGKVSHYKAISESGWKIQPVKQNNLLENPTTTGSKTQPELVGKSNINQTDQITRPNMRPIRPLSKDDGFEKFWSAYPRKTAKGAAKKAWGKIKPSAELIATILAAIENQRQSDQWTKDGGMFIPYPATWLNQERWADEVQTTTGEDGQCSTLPWNIRNLSDDDFQRIQREIENDKQ